MATVADLRNDFGASASDDEALARALVMAEDALTIVVAQAWRPVPLSVQDEAVRRYAYAIFKGRATNDGGNMLGADGSTGIVGVANDPMRKVWPLIKPYVRRF